MLEILYACKSNINKDDCQLNSAGVKNLGKANWPMLEMCCISKKNKYSDENKLGCDVLYALTTFNTQRLKQINLDMNISSWVVVHAFTMNAEEAVNIRKFRHENETIQRDVTEMLKIKFKFLSW